mmetsp:Transcript_53088/g.113369  ORF Transcript_53088/g.113369 Transcript_53088/m.113369 type:complete len:134 (+) Transcript_53088:251-652(+)
MCSGRPSRAHEKCDTSTQQISEADQRGIAIAAQRSQALKPGSQEALKQLLQPGEVPHWPVQQLWMQWSRPHWIKFPKQYPQAEDTPNSRDMQPPAAGWAAPVRRAQVCMLLTNLELFSLTPLQLPVAEACTKE